MNPHEDFEVMHRQTKPFFITARQTLRQLGFEEIAPRVVLRKPQGPYDQEVLQAAQKGQHGLVILLRRPEQPWRSKIAYKAKEKIVVLMNPEVSMKNALVPIDFSLSSLLTLMFLKQTYMQNLDLNLRFVHLRPTAERGIEQRWEKMKKTAGLVSATPLEVIETQGDIATALLRIIRADGFDTIIMGRRGISRIKRWVLGSVSAAILGSIAQETLILID
jgi:2,4-dienoyl-CoA reductase (NADPH2)